MDHLEAQSYIMPFIEGKIPEEKQVDFVLHMRNCPKCYDELETYYTLIVGMRQLSDNKKMSTDFKKNLDQDLTKLLSKAKGRKNIRFSAYSFILILIIVFMGLFYAQCINRVYKFEQDTKLEAQGENYFSAKIYDNLLMDNRLLSTSKDKFYQLDHIEVISYKEMEITNVYNKIRGYNELLTVNQEILNVGGDILNGKITSH